MNDVARAARLARSAGAFSVIDAVHYALHGPIDVRAIGCDFLLCSAYKFFGPHVGVLYARRAVTDHVEPVRLATQEQEQPYIWETGHARPRGHRRHDGGDRLHRRARARATAPSSRTDVPAGLSGRRRDIVAGMLAAEAYEQPLAARLREQLRAVPGVTLYGPPEDSPRTSTVSFTLDGFSAEQACRALGARGIFAWDGHFYAFRLVQKLGLLDRGGLIRIGLAPYNTAAELERLVDRRGRALALGAMTAHGRGAAARVRDVRLCLLGFGNVARAFCELLARQERVLAERHGLRVLVTAAGTRHGSFYAPGGRARREELLAAAPAGRLPQAARPADDLLAASGADVLVELTVMEKDFAPRRHGAHRGRLRASAWTW